jgi:hypothetical protein
MKTGGVGGANTLTGLNFENKVDFQKLLAGIPGYNLAKIPNKAGMGVFFERKLVARCFRKHDFYKFLDESNINWQKVISKKLLRSCQEVCKSDHATWVRADLGMGMPS